VKYFAITSQNNTMKILLKIKVLCYTLQLFVALPHKCITLILITLSLKNPAVQSHIPFVNSPSILLSNQLLMYWTPTQPYYFINVLAHQEVTKI